MPDPTSVVERRSSILSLLKQLFARKRPVGREAQCAFLDRVPLKGRNIEDDQCVPLGISDVYPEVARLVPAGPDHAQVAAARGVAEYFDALDAHHGGGDAAGRAQRVRSLLREAEKPLLRRLLGYLSSRKDLRLLGPADAEQRAATVSVVSLRHAPADLNDRLTRVEDALIDLAVVVGEGHLDHLASANMSPVVVEAGGSFKRSTER